MAYKIQENIGVHDLQNLTEIIHYGHVHSYVEGIWFFSQSKWIQRYLVLCKSNVEKPTWSLCCFKDAFSKKAETSYSLLEFESCKDFDDHKGSVVGFVLRFEKPTEKPLTFRCDTKDSRKVWIEKLQDAIKEAHKDSGYSSDVDRQSKKYDTIDDYDDDEEEEEQEQQQQQQTNDAPELSNLKSDQNNRKKTKSTVSCQKFGETASCETGGLPKYDYENWKIPGGTFSKSTERRTEIQDMVVTSESRNGTENTHVKELLSPPVQETKPDNKCEEAPVKLQKLHERRKTRKTNEKQQSTPAQPTLSAETFPQVENLYENANNDEKAEKECEKYGAKKKEVLCELVKVLGKRNTQRDHKSREGKLESDNISNTQSPVASGQANRDENTALKVPEDLPGVVSERCDTTTSSFFSLSGHTESFVSVSNGCITDTKDECEDDDCNIYENTSPTCKKEVNDQCQKENDNKRDSCNSNTSSLHSTQSSSSFSSRDSTTSIKYESPDESANDENTCIFRKNEYLCDEKTDVKRALQSKPSGTFLVRPTESVTELCVATDIGIRYFRIHIQEEKLSLFKQFTKQENIFPSLDKLLNFYHTNELPSKNFKVKLERGYRCEKSV